MVKYDRLWRTMKEKGITQYDLYHRYGIETSLLDRLRKGKNIEIYTLDRLCTILDCDFGDIVEHIPNERPEEDEKSRPSSE
ncbi:MAG: helix-turn-helix transcriptional regulator [Clostridiales bacterium]|nr:helix-turn-helix transcriptional regulator [Clostridiales bacterium]